MILTDQPKQSSNIKQLLESTSNNTALENIIAPCDKAVRPIFPVRFSFSPEKLIDLASNKAQPCIAEKTLANPGEGYELRRIRQGFVYILAETKCHDEETTDEDAIWQIFRYETARDDENSSNARDDTEFFYGEHQRFYKYKWIDGSVRGRWQALKDRIYPFAFVSKDTSKVHIAYSEERWPSWFFERASVDKGFRAKLMQGVDLLAPETDYSCPLEELENKVEDFKPDLKDRIGSYYINSQTGIKQEPVSNVFNCRHSRENGRIIAVHDQLGKLLDINQQLTNANQLQTKHAEEVLYPFTIAKAIERVKEDVDESWNWFKELIQREHPINGDEYSKFLKEERSRVDEVDNLLKAFSATLNHQHIGDYYTQIELAENGLSTQISSKEDLERLEYMSFLSARTLRSIGCTDAGGEYLLATWDNKPKGESKLGEVLRKSAGLWAKVKKSLIESSLRSQYAFDVLIQTSFTQLAMIEVNTPHSIGMSAIQNVTNISSITERPVAIDNIIGVLDGSIDLDTIDLSVSHSSTTVSSVYMGGEFSTGSSVTVTLDLPHVEIDHAILPAAGFQSAARGAYYPMLAVEGVSGFLNVFSVYTLISKKDEVSKSRTMLGRISDNFYLNLTLSLTEALSAATTVATVATRAGSLQSMTSAMYQELYTSLRTSGQASTAVTDAYANNATSRSVKIIDKAGKIAGAVGILLSGFKAYDGYKSDDQAKLLGNSFLMVSGLLGLFMTTGVGFALVILLLIVGAVIEIFGARSDLEKWVAESFWGTSDSYWDKERVSIQQQIDGAIELASNKKMQKDFKQEVTDLENIFMGFAIIDGQYRDYKFQISLPRLNESPFNLRVDVEVVYIEKPKEGSWYNTFGVNVIKTKVLSDLKHVIDYDKCKVMVDFESALPQNMISIEKITVLVDYKRPAATKFKEFNQEKEIYNRIRDYKNNNRWSVQ
jgi:hypothetical protein